MEYKTIILAGLIHDIGKFLQKGKFGKLDTKGKHPEVSAVFVRAFKERLQIICNANLLEELVKKHHESPAFPDYLKVQSALEDILPLAYIISRADNYSSSERGEKNKEYIDYKKRPLDSVFGRLNIGKEIPLITQYKDLEYTPENGYPTLKKEQKENDINTLLKKFGDKFSNIVKEIKDFSSFYNQLYSLLLKYTWCIPSNTQEQIADISLFDHLKTTSAIAACMYKYHSFNDDFTLQTIKNDNLNKFKVVVGDLSGIQNYIFAISNIGAGGVAKRLRARSFSLSMLSELASQKIINTFNLPISNILMASGGKFYILLPNTEETSNKLQDIKKEIADYLLKEYQGEIAINISSIELSGNDFKKFGNVITALSKKLEVKKRMPFSEVIFADELWKEEKFVFKIPNKNSITLCKGCGKEYLEKEAEYGTKCLKDEDIGKNLPKAKIIEFSNSQNCDIKFAGDIGINIVEDYSKNDSSFIMLINDNSINANYSMINKYFANYVPVNNNQTKSFDEIVEKCKGIKRLGYLKADVDNLGNLFTFGLKSEDQEQKDYDSISRVTTLSRMLDLFFSGRINQLIKNEYPDCYIVYSGGDDLLVIGPWNEIIDFSIRMQKEFRKFVGNNQNITISAGIGIEKTKTPVAKAVEDSERLLELSKEEILKGKETGRNQVSIFNRTMSWEDFETCILEAKKLIKWFEKGWILKADLWKMKKYEQLFQEFHKKGKVEGLKYGAFLAYDIGRKKKNNKANEEVISWQKKLLDITNPVLINLGCIIDYTIFACREANKE